jgi:hypothetical protein
LKGSKGKDCEIPAPVGISITDENGKIIGECIDEGFWEIACLEFQKNFFKQ